jgi:hypothetical protein
VQNNVKLALGALYVLGLVGWIYLLASFERWIDIVWRL